MCDKSRKMKQRNKNNGHPKTTRTKTGDLSFVITLGRLNKDKNIFPRGGYADDYFTTMHKRVIESECLSE
jgi:hypothetical protein